MDDRLRYRITFVSSSLLGIIGIVFILLGSGYDKFTGYSENTGIPIISGIGFLMLLFGALVYHFGIKKRKKN